MIPGARSSSPGDRALWLESLIKDFCGASPANRLHNGEAEPAVDEPLVGFSSGADPLYLELQQDIGPFYMTPMEIFNGSFPEISASASDLTVISIILPLTQRTREDNRLETYYPSERWARAKHYGEDLCAKLCVHLVETLEQAGYPAVAPEYEPSWSIGISEKYGRASTWSQRHAAYVSGLGTFGLCDGLITEKGIAIRCESVIARLSVPPTPRSYSDHHAYCLFYAQGTCGLCIGRCPVGAISEEGHDKVRCRAHVNGVTTGYVKERFGLDNYGCGLCQTGVPCESRNPLSGQPKK